MLLHTGRAWHPLRRTSRTGSPRQVHRRTAPEAPTGWGTLPSVAEGRRFAQVDVFSSVPCGGNPVAVVLDAEGLDAQEMQRLAAWTDLSETTFVLPPQDPGADYRVRVFTPSVELPFAGHPTLGTCHAWLGAGGAPRHDGTVVQECGVGLVHVRRREGRLAFAGPPLVRSGPVEPGLRGRLLDVLRLRPDDVVDAAWVDNGPGWVAVLLHDAEAVAAVEPRDSELYVGVVGPCPAGDDASVEVRAFFPVAGRSVEDPVTGSLNAGLAAWLVGSGRAPRSYVARQGTARGRDGRVHLDHDGDGTVWVGGVTTTVVEGLLHL